MKFETYDEHTNTLTYRIDLAEAVKMNFALPAFLRERIEIERQLREADPETRKRLFQEKKRESFLEPDEIAKLEQ